MEFYKFLILISLGITLTEIQRNTIRSAGALSLEILKKLGESHFRMLFFELIMLVLGDAENRLLYENL
jgi:hypothetical protein